MNSEYYFLRQDLFNSRGMADIAGHSEESGKFIWIAGVKFSTPPSALRLVLDYSYGKQFPDFFDTTVPVMSQRLVEALTELGVTNFDICPVTLIDPRNNSEINGFFAINLIGEMDAIDWSRSEHRLRFGRPKATGLIHLQSQIVSRRKAFRLKGGPGFIVVEQAIADAIKKLNLKAVLLQSLSDYDDI
jgi:hypothetical protein